MFGIFLALALCLSFSSFGAQLDPAPFCGPVRNPKVPPPDCRYFSGDKRFSLPTEAEWSRNVDGQRSGLINLYLHGSLESLMQDFIKAGWTESSEYDRKDNRAYLHAAAQFLAAREALHIYGDSPELQKKLKDKLQDSVFRNRIEARARQVEEVIASMPVSDEYVCGKLQVAAFEKDNEVIGGRHHFRIFDLGQVDVQGQPVWGISATQDIGLYFDFDHKLLKRGFLNHKIQFNADGERNKLLSDLESIQAVVDVVPFPVAFSCSAPGDHAYSKDGENLEIFLQP